MVRTLADKVLILGVDGMDPRVAKHFMDEGKMPNLKKYVENGAARDNLQLLGAHPTVTPPMWTTLATGAYPQTHGITDYHNQSKESLDTIVYSFDSRLCKAEQLWNVCAEVGKKTLVWHWPGSSWPPTSDSPNLHVVDGLTPGAIGMAGGLADNESVLVASEKFKKVTVVKNMRAVAAGTGCVIDDLNLEDSDNHLEKVAMGNEITNVQLSYLDGDEATEEIPLDFINTPITPAEGWAAAPADAKEFTILENNSLIRHPVLILKNESGIYDHIEIYEKKDQKKLLIRLYAGEVTNDYITPAFFRDEPCKVNRVLSLFHMEPDGSNLKMYLCRGMVIGFKDYCHPLSLYDQIVEGAGYLPGMPSIGGAKAELIEGGLLPVWENYTKWQNRAMKHLIDSNQYDVVFSHVHNVDICAHVFYRLSIYRKGNPNIEVEKYPGFIERLYRDTDRYLGEFMEYLDKGYTIFIVSDHGGVIPFEDRPPLLGDPLGVNAMVMRSLGYTALKEDENGNPLPEIDWEHTKALATRAAYIWINLKGRNPHGIVEPEDKYALEGKIIDDLYNYRDPATGKRVVSLALRRKEAALVGLDSDECGDIIYFIDEGFNRVHGDGLSTNEGPLHTSVSPIFVACGKGIKAGYTCERVIRQVDVAPTVASVLGVRMPAQCEGAPVYQILDGDFVSR